MTRLRWHLLDHYPGNNRSYTGSVYTKFVTSDVAYWKKADDWVVVVETPTLIIGHQARNNWTRVFWKE